MQIKGWQFGFTAIFIQILILIYLFYLYFKTFNPLLNNKLLNQVTFISALIIFTELIFMLSITVLLKSNEMKKIGAIIGIFFGIAVVGMFGGLFTEFLNEIYLDEIPPILDLYLGFTSIPGFLLIVSGIHYFWKKV